MKEVLFRLRGPFIAIIALALSSSLAFAAQPISPGAAGRANAATHNGLAGASGDEEAAGDEEGTGDEETEETEGTEEESSESADNCLTDPTALLPEDLEAMKHGSIVCWAAQQTEWPEWFSNHGAFVSCWAHQGKADAPSCTEAPADDLVAATTSHGQGKGKAKGKGHKDAP